MARAFVRIVVASIGFGAVVTACGSTRDRVPHPAAASPQKDGGITDPSLGEGGAALGPCSPPALEGAHGLTGCHFVMTALSAATGTFSRVGSGCWALVVSNPSAERVRLRLRHKGRDASEAREEDASPYARRAVVGGRDVRYEPLDDGSLGPRESAVVSALFVPFYDTDTSQNSVCPTPAFIESREPGARNEQVTPAIELLSDRPVGVIHAGLFEPDARGRAAVPSRPFPLVPVHLWETSAIETGVFKPGHPSKLVVQDEHGETYDDPFEPASTLAMAAFDDTHVQLPTADGASRSVTLQRGEVFAHITSEAATGRVAVADKPVGLITYAGRTLIPWDTPLRLFPDSPPSSSMALPTRVWGSEYVAVRHGDRWEGRPEEPAWRMLGGADDTVLAYEPYKPMGAPDRLAKGELAVFFADAPFVVRSQDEAHRFYFGGTMTASAYQRQRHEDFEPYHESRGTGFSVHVLPTALFEKQYAFFALPSFPEQSVVLVRARGGGEVRLDCAGVVGAWEPVGDRFEYTRVRLSGHLYEPVDHAGGRCEAGEHWIESDGAFWGTVWAWGNTDTNAALNRGTQANAYALPFVAATSRPNPSAQD